MVQEDEPKCPECGNSIYSRVHLEGRDGIHEKRDYFEPFLYPIMQTATARHDVLSDMTNGALVALCEERGLEIPQRPTKAQLVALLEKVT